MITETDGVTDSAPNYGAGVVASLIAEAAFMTMVAIVSGMRGMDPWAVVSMPGSFLLGPAAAEPAGFVPGDVAAGLLMHVGLGVLVGLIYAALLPRLGISPIAGGIVAGTVLYALGFWALPLMFPAWLAPFWLPATDRMLQAVAHAAYGVVFGLTFQRLQ